MRVYCLSFWYLFRIQFVLQACLSKVCHNILQKSINFDDPSIDTATKNDYRINGWGMSNTAQK